MTKTNRFLAVLLVSLFCVASAFAQTQPPKPEPPPAPLTTKSIDLGQLDGVNYVNQTFGLSLSIPRDWVVVTAQSRPQFNEEVKKLVQSPDKAKEAQVRESINRSAILLSLTKLQAGQPDNAGFMLIAERIPTPALKTGLDVIQSMKRTMAGTNFNVEFEGEAVAEQVSGASFGVVTIKNTSPYGSFNQKIYVTVKQGYALQFFFTYTNAADLPVYDALVKSIKIN